MNATLVNLASLLDAYGGGDVAILVSAAVLRGRRVLLTRAPMAGAHAYALPTVRLKPGERLLEAGERAGQGTVEAISCGRLLVLVESIAGAEHRLQLTFGASARTGSGEARGIWASVTRLGDLDLDPWIAFGLRTALGPGRRTPVHVVADPTIPTGGEPGRVPVPEPASSHRSRVTR
ncbi:MAG TPA: hypothetical protein VET65_13200 [Candidatus Limnocylindrales bacterium]|nr:hypothetical protein [Candidatus Limnocylindrales bacterium]